MPRTFPPSREVTRLLSGARAGDPQALGALWELVYEELHHIAHHQLRRMRPGETINTTALVHEAYLKLGDPADAEWENRTHFFSVAARAMRHILVDYARRQQAEKRGGGDVDVRLDEAVIQVGARSEIFLGIDAALTQLAQLNERLSQIVEYRFFGGMTEQEIADLLDLSPRTVRRDWRKAKAWLSHALAPYDAEGDPPLAP